MASRNRKKVQALRNRKCLSFEGLEVRRLLASDWQNPGQALDVNGDLSLAPIDALLGINRLNLRAPRTLPARAPGSSEPYFDTNGDGSHSAVDALTVINALNRNLPTVAIALQKDSGIGTGASSDRRTTDLSIKGNVSRTKATELWGRFSGDADWHKLVTFSPTATSQAFTISHDDLIAELGTPSDGLVTLQFQPRFGATNSDVGNEADLPVTFDRTPPQFNFELQPNYLGSITLPQPGTIEIPLNERASASTLVPSKVKLFNASFLGFEQPEELVPRSISLSSDGRFLLIEPPTTTQSISYSVSVQEGAFEDLAGNLNIAFRTDAHHFSDASQTPLAFGQKVDFSTTQRAVKEYTFELTSPDLFILAGLEASSAMQMDLFAPSGRSLRNWVTETTGGSLELDSANRAMLTELGEYTLRIAASPTTNVSFKALLAKQLTSIPASSPLQGTSTWAESHAFSVNLANQNRIYFENNLNPEAPFRVTLLDQYGQDLAPTDFEGDRVFTVTTAGRYIALIEPVTTVRPSSYDFTVHLSQVVSLPLTFDQFQQNTLTTPGQQVFYTFAARAARTYTLEIEKAEGSVTIALPGLMEVNQQGAFAVEDSGEGYILLELNQAGLPSALTRFRVVESISTVTPPPVATVRTEQMVQGVTRKTIQVEQESYEFTFTATAGELYAFASSGIGFFDLLSPTGSTIDPVEQSEGLRVYRIPYAGQYRLRAIGDVLDELLFQWQRLSTATSLSANAVVNGTIPSEIFAAYRFAANNSRFFVFPTTVANGLVWKLIDENGMS